MALKLDPANIPWLVGYAVVMIVLLALAVFRPKKG